MNTPPRRPAVRQRDLQRILKAAKAAGLDIARVEIDPTGKISIFARGERDDVHATSLVELWKARRDARAS
jgi:hypothetical protein